MRRADIKLLFLIALMATLVMVSSCSNPEDPKDTTDPTVAITAPENNAFVPNTVDVVAEASDNEEVTKGNLATFNFLWQTGEVATQKDIKKRLLD